MNTGSGAYFVNDGTCSVCGHLQEEIAAGKVKPCFEWRLNGKADDEEEPEEGHKVRRKVLVP